MRTLEQMNVIIEKVKEQGNYDSLVNYTCKNYREFDSEVLEVITDIILETNDLRKIVFLAQKIKTVNIKKVVEKVLTINNNNIESVFELIRVFIDIRCEAQYIDLATKCRDYIFKNADIKSSDGKQIISYTYNSYRVFLNGLTSTENIDEDVKKVVDAKLQEHEILYAKMEELINQAKGQKEIDDKNKKIKEFKDRAGIMASCNCANYSKKNSYRDYTDNEHGEFEKLLGFIQCNKKIFTEEDKKAIIGIAQTILKISYTYIQSRNMDDYDIIRWNTEYTDREKLYIEDCIKKFLRQFPDSGMSFVDIILKCEPKRIAEFKEIEEFPYDIGYEKVKKHDKGSKSPKRGETLVNYVINTQENHQYDITDLENFVLDYYLPDGNEPMYTPMYTLYHKVNGVNKEKIEDFLFNFSVDITQKPDEFFGNSDYDREKTIELYQKVNIRNLALSNLISYDRVKYSRVQIENKYIKTGIIDNSYRKFIDTDKNVKYYKKWENFFCGKGTSSQILDFLNTSDAEDIKDKIDVNRCLTACVNKNDEDLASSIYSIMTRYYNVNLIVLERMLIETGNEELYKKFINNQELQARYFKQLLETEMSTIGEQQEFIVPDDNRQPEKSAQKRKKNSVSKK